MKKIKCEVCGYEFDPIKSNRYTVRGNGKCGLSALSGGDETKLYDAFDCPVCGCQAIAGERKRRYAEKEEEEGIDEE